VDALLLAWFRANGAELPWRRTNDPYAVLVSEVMLQQKALRSMDLALQQGKGAFLHALATPWLARRGQEETPEIRTAVRTQVEL
jgi:hypothetical protein